MRYKVQYEIRKNDLPKIASNLQQGADDAVAEAVLLLVRFADPATPVDTGNLKNHKTINTGSGGKGFVHWHAEYVAFVHNGTRYMPGRPFIEQAVQQVWPLYQQAMRDLAQGEGI
jgi:HK97 gp10 family phage protein